MSAGEPIECQIGDGDGCKVEADPALTPQMGLARGSVAEAGGSVWFIGGGGLNGSTMVDSTTVADASGA